MGKLNSHDEWSPLREVILGRAEGYAAHDWDLSFDLFFMRYMYPAGRPPASVRASASARERAHAIDPRHLEELTEDVEGIATILSSLGVVVHRPLRLPSDVRTIGGLGWEAVPTPALNIRDNTLVLGDEIIETPPAIRSRYLETRLLAPIFRDYFDAGAKWTTMPRPLLSDASFDRSYAHWIQEQVDRKTAAIDEPVPSPMDVGHEMMLDGAQCVRLGRDVLINVANANHVRAVDWLERHLNGRYRIHRISRMSGDHIDSMILALRPGLFLCRDVSVQGLLPERFRRWKCLVPPKPTRFPRYTGSDLTLSSAFIDLNVLSLSPTQVLVNEDFIDLIAVLEREGFEVIPVRHRHRRLFGGGFHCFTLDTVRDGGLEDYT